MTEFINHQDDELELKDISHVIIEVDEYDQDAKSLKFYSDPKKLFHASCMMGKMNMFHSAYKLPSDGSNQYHLVDPYDEEI